MSISRFWLKTCTHTSTDENSVLIIASHAHRRREHRLTFSGVWIVVTGGRGGGVDGARAVAALVKNDSHELRGPVLYDGGSPEEVLLLPGLFVRLALLLLLTADGMFSRVTFLGVLLVLLLLCDVLWRKMPPKSFFMAPRASRASIFDLPIWCGIRRNDPLKSGYFCKIAIINNR